MAKKFNDTGLCIPHRHYMVDTSQKLAQIMRLIEAGEYFTINRPRQFGKTTTLALLTNKLNQRDDYVALEISFEGIGDAPFASEQTFAPAFLRLIAQSVKFTVPEMASYFEQASRGVHDLEELSDFISSYVLELNKNVVLLIDEVDKSSNNQIFLHFLGMLRNKYLQYSKGRDHTFHSVILAGVHDIKTLKAKIWPTPPDSGGELKGGYNSPWNIAIDFKVDLSFSALEIESMLQDYSREQGIQPDIPAIAERLYYYSSGYPYLVSKLCKFIDEDIMPARTDKTWTVAEVEAAFKLIVAGGYTTTLFESLVKNLENNEDLYDLVFQLIINGEQLNFIIDDPMINLAHLYGIISPSEQGKCQIHNRIFEQRLYSYMLSKFIRKKYSEVNRLGGPQFYTPDGLDLKLILQRFQAFMKEHYSEREAKFLEQEGRLLFLAYLRSIINGQGFDFKEPNVGDEQRMDVVITHQNKRYVLELKLWRGPKYHQVGLQQLSDYLDLYGLSEGYLLIYDFNKNKVYKDEQIPFKDKQIYAVWV